MPVHLSIYLSIDLSIYLYIYLAIKLSIYIHIYLLNLVTANIFYNSILLSNNQVVYLDEDREENAHHEADHGVPQQRVLQEDRALKGQ